MTFRLQPQRIDSFFVANLFDLTTGRFRTVFRLYSPANFRIAFSVFIACQER